MKTRMLSMLRRFFGTSRVLQVEEVRHAVAEQLCLTALPGLSRRYLPSAVSVRVGREDFRCLRPFEAQLRSAIRQDVEKLTRRQEWRPTAEKITLALAKDVNMPPGGTPKIITTFAKGTRHAAWWPSIGEDKPGSVPEKRSRATVLRLVITALAQGDTALQEEVQVVFDRQLAVSDLNLLGEETLILDPEQGVVTEPDREPWDPPSGVHVEHGAPPEVSFVAQRLRTGWDSAWVAFVSPGGPPRLLWCPGGVLLLGRTADAAHLVPGAPAQVLSRSHLALWQAGPGELYIMDLESTNGTFTDATRMPAWQPVRLQLPAKVQIGREGLFMVDLR